MAVQTLVLNDSEQADREITTSVLSRFRFVLFCCFNLISGFNYLLQELLGVPYNPIKVVINNGLFVK